MMTNRDRYNTRQRTRTVFVPIGGGSKIETEELSVSENGTYEAGEDKAYSKVTVKVTEPIESIKIADYGIKFGNNSFTEIPEWVDWTGITDLSHMFHNCDKIETFPVIDTSRVTNMSSMFNNCRYNLVTVPEMDTSQVTDMSYMFYYCWGISSIPSLNTSKVTNMSNMFGSCHTKSIPEMDTSQVTDMSYMFFDCVYLTGIPEMNVSQVTNMENMFWLCSDSITDLGGFVELKINLDLSPCTALTHDSLMNVINKAADVTASPATLTLGSDNLAKLSDEEKAIATGKGWTLA